MRPKLSFIINTIIIVSVAVALIIAAATTQQYTYYTFLRWLVMTTCIYLGYKSYKRKRNGHLIFFAAVAILFNPLRKVWLQKETWHLVNYIVAIIFLLIICFEWMIFLKGYKTFKKM